jgi:ubiquinone/menaquinone biosynthesis C-methylase UbiE
MSHSPLHLKILARVMRAFFSLLYHQLAWTYDFVAALVSLGMWKDWVASVLPDLSGPRVLELGHGPGYLQAMLEKRGIQAFGVDESPQMGMLAVKRSWRQDRKHCLYRGYAQFLPFADETFNQVVSTFPSEYILDPPTLSETCRVLVPGGTFVVLPVAWITGQNWMECGAAWLFRVTGQSEDWDAKMLTPFLDAGFQTELKRITHKRWTLLMIIAEKR